MRSDGLETIPGLDPKCELASDALQGILLHQQTATDLHPTNAQAIAESAEETGAEALHYPSDSGSWQLGDIDLSEHLAKHHDCTS